MARLLVLTLHLFSVTRGYMVYASRLTARGIQRYSIVRIFLALAFRLYEYAHTIQPRNHPRHRYDA